MDNVDKIEFRSEKTRQLIGQIPSKYLRFSTLVSVGVLLVLFVCACFIPYPENLKVKAVVHATDTVKLYISYSYLNDISVGMDVEMDFDGFPINTYGYLHGEIIMVYDDVVVLENMNYFVAFVSPNIDCLNERSAIVLRQNMIGGATILLSNESVLLRIINMALH